MKVRIMNPKIKSSLLSTLLACSVGLTACGGGGNTAATTPVGPVVSELAAPLTIDSAGVIPAFTDTPVSTAIYVHNNSSEEIKNLSFSYETNVSDNKGSAKAASLGQQASQVKSIPAGGKLSLPVNIPALAVEVQRGTIQITAQYTHKGEQKTFKQVLNFHVISSKEPGVFLSSGSRSSGFGNKDKDAYTTLYVYGGGQDKTYTIDPELELDPVLGKEIQGKIEGSGIASHQVLPIELKTKEVANSTSGEIHISARDSDNTPYKSSQVVRVMGDAEEQMEAVIYQTKTPVINTDVTKDGTAYIYNAGTTTATISAISGDNGITVTNQSDCTTLDAGQGCTIKFNVTSDSGSGYISVNYHGGVQADGTTSIQVDWRKASSGVGQFVVETDDPSIVLTGALAPFTATTKVMVTNVGLNTITNIQASDPTTLKGSALSKVSSQSNNCANAKLAFGDECTYEINTTDNKAPDPGQLGVKVSGDGGVVPVTATVDYDVKQSEFSLDVSNKDDINSLEIIGDNDDTAKTATIVFTNTGEEDIPALDETIDTTKLNGIAVTNSDNCNGKELKAGDSCEETVELKTQTNEGNTALTGSITYSAADKTGVQSATVDLVVQPQASHLELASVSAIGNASGDGSEATPFDFKAGQAGAKQVVLTYKNTGTKPMIINGIDKPKGLNTTWTIEGQDQDSNSCLPIEGATVTAIPLGVGETCRITLNNELAKYGDSGTTTNLNIALPQMSVSYNGSTSYNYFVPINDNFKDGVVHAENHQANITNTNRVDATTTDLLVTHAISGFADGGYGDGLKLDTVMTNGEFLKHDGQGRTVAPGCELKTDSNAMVKEECTFTADNTSFTSTYPINYAQPEVDNGAAQLSITNTISGYSPNPSPDSVWAYFNGVLADGVNGSQEIVDLESKDGADADLVMFVTKETYTGDLVTEAKQATGTDYTTGFEAADALCQAEADASQNVDISGGTGINKKTYKAFLVGNKAFTEGKKYITAGGEFLGTATGPDYAEKYANPGLYNVELTNSDGAPITYDETEALTKANVNKRMAWTGWNPNMKFGEEAGGFSDTIDITKKLSDQRNNNALTILSGIDNNCDSWTSDSNSGVAGSVGTPVDSNGQLKPTLISDIYGNYDSMNGLIQPTLGWISGKTTSGQNGTGVAFYAKSQLIPTSLFLGTNDSDTHGISPTWDNGGGKVRTSRADTPIKGYMQLFMMPESSDDIYTSTDRMPDKVPTSAQNTTAQKAPLYGEKNFQMFPSRFGDYAPSCSYKLHLYCVAQPKP